MGISQAEYRELLHQEGLRAAAKSSNRRVMNKTEAAYAQHLEIQKRAGLIDWYGFEAVKLRLANRTWYTPDFVVCLSITNRLGYLRIVEVKGFWRDDARVKIKVAAEQFPWARFVVVTRKGDGWKEEQF